MKSLKTSGAKRGFIPHLSREKKGEGFTLIEILVVISIIAVLASVVLIGLGPVQRQGRDARRISDLRQIQNALELYYAKCGYYPGTAQSGLTCTGFSQISQFNDGNCSAGTLCEVLKDSNIGVNQVPDDPTSGKHYFYGTDSNGVGYAIGATLEDSRNPALQRSPQGTIDGVICNAPVYCIQF